MHVLRKQKTSLGRVAQAESSRVRNPGEVLWLVVLGFMVMGFVSTLFLANHSDSGSFLVACASLSQDEFQQEGSWEVSMTHGMASPLSSQPLLSSPRWHRVPHQDLLPQDDSCKQVSSCSL